MKNAIRILLCVAIILPSCKKSFLDAKPNSSIVNPMSLNDYQLLLDNFRSLNTTGALSQMSSDEYFIKDKASFDALDQQTYKGAYLWAKDLYGGEINILDWNQPYKGVFYANSVLDGIKQIDQTNANQADYNNIKGEALFFRCYAFYDLAKSFCPVYNQTSASTDLGLPLRTSSGIDVTLQRSNLKQTFDLIIADLQQATVLLREDFSVLNRNRPSKCAAFAMLARVYLYMGNYVEAGKAANSSLAIYNKLIDYNKISKTSATPFSYSSDETIFYSSQEIAYTLTTGYGTAISTIGVDPNLLALYSNGDLRSSIFFAKNTFGNFNVKRGYVGGGFYAFTGLAVDEVLLVSAECAARLNDPQTAANALNKLLVNRLSASSFTPLVASTPAAALSMVLLERRKELVWRALRWSDIKRLNRDGANIILQRILNGVTYTLSPNSPLYTFPIPSDEIALSGIEQNNR